MITGEVILSYPAIFEPKENLSGVMKYSAQLLIPKTDKKTIAELEAEIESAKAKGKTGCWSNKIPAFRYQPMRDGDAELASGDKEDPIYKGMMFLNASASEEYPPQVVGPDAKPLMDRTKVYPGVIVRVSLSAYPYKQRGNAGIGWGLNSLMVVRDGEHLDGRKDAEDEFAQFAQVDDAADPNLM